MYFTSACQLMHTWFVEVHMDINPCVAALRALKITIVCYAVYSYPIGKVDVLYSL